jgi:hypothetical protein
MRWTRRQQRHGQCGLRWAGNQRVLRGRPHAPRSRRPGGPCPRRAPRRGAPRRSEVLVEGVFAAARIGGQNRAGFYPTLPHSSEVLVEGDLVAARVGAQAGHDARLLVVAHALLEEVGLAPARRRAAASQPRLPTVALQPSTPPPCKPSFTLVRHPCPCVSPARRLHANNTTPARCPSYGRACTGVASSGHGSTAGQQARAVVSGEGRVLYGVGYPTLWCSARAGAHCSDSISIQSNGLVAA